MNRYLSAFFLTLLWTSTVFADDAVIGRLSGAWIPPAIGPVSGGLIYAFNANSGPPPQRDRPLRSPDAVSVTDNEGKFSLELPQGAYYLSTRKQFNGDAPGPPQDGDLYGLIRDQKGKLILYTVKSGMTTDIGILRQATVYRERTIKLTKGMTAIAGSVKAIDGSPLADAVVLVYSNPQTQRKPDFVSHKTGKDGKYIVKVNREGLYFVTAREANNSGGRPKTGDLIGVYGGETAQPVTVKKNGVTKGIDIQIGQFVDNRPDNRPE